jgi:beta-galactosidase
MELTDEMGFLVMSEILDMWRLPKNEYDYARFFDEWIERDVASWVRRDRNCPSVILWSIGNEIYDTHASFEEGASIMRMLSDLVAKHDPNSHAVITFSSNYMPWENTQKCADIIKNIGYNYAEELYQNHHAAFPDWVIYGGEVCSIVQSRGVYHFPLSKELLHDDDMQCSALGNSRTSWGAKSIEKCITDDRDALFSQGLFLWSGFDYIGEPTPYHTKNSFFGQIDTAGFPKDSYYIFKSAWTDYKTDPFVHVFPYWDFSPGQIIDVRICTNAPKAELFLNEKSLGVFEVNHKSDKKLVGDFRVPYEPGKLTGVAYDENGYEVARTVRNSFGDVATLDVKAESFGELVFYEISALDKDGNIVENANTRVNVSVTGGELLGLDNGDSTDYDQYKSESRRLFNGKLTAIARGDGLGNTVITARIDTSDIPVRKIELTADGYTVKAKIYPENADGQELHWRLADAGGNESGLGELRVSADGRRAAVVPKADGEVWVRCRVKNGKENISLLSLISLKISKPV